VTLRHTFQIETQDGKQQAGRSNAKVSDHPWYSAQLSSKRNSQDSVPWSASDRRKQNNYD